MWDETLIRKLALETALENLSARVFEVAAQVDTQLVSAEKLQELTFETSASIQATNAQIADASSTLSHELEALRSVTNELHTNLTQIPSLMLSSGWLPNLLGPLSSMMNGLRFPTWQAQLVMQVVGVGASGIQNSLSLLLTVFKQQKAFARKDGGKTSRDAQATRLPSPRVWPFEAFLRAASLRGWVALTSSHCIITL
ncbi:hypothetical protein FRC10_004071 [Ceratobasidium sp. 414]|nr:hypothetical protein FRC10_004071 [Ceratobasidium sp. 414]